MFKSGYVSLLGKPNVGKSTLLNALVGQKVSIVSSKPQTTRRRVLGIATGEGFQVAFIDTPGIHEPHTRLGRAMVEQARMALGDVDLLVYVANGATAPDEADKSIAKLLSGVTQRGFGSPDYKAHPFTPPVILTDEEGEEMAEVPVSIEYPEPEGATRIVLCLNKMDQLKAQNVAKHIHLYCDLFGTDRYMLTTATQGVNLDKLMDMIVDGLPEGEPMYSEDEFTDQSSRFLAAELVREKILLASRQEIPHATAVLVESWDEEEAITRIQATIFVEKSSQRAILIGKGGEFLKKVGTQARQEIEQMLGQKVFLQLHVKVREGWRQDPRTLKELEYSE